MAEADEFGVYAPSLSERARDMPRSRSIRYLQGGRGGEPYRRGSLLASCVRFSGEPDGGLIGLEPMQPEQWLGDYVLYPGSYDGDIYG